MEAAAITSRVGGRDMVRLMRSSAPVLAFACLLSLSGCSVPVGDGNAVLWQGYRYDWEDLSHRVAYLRSAVADPDESGSFTGRIGIIGGDWSTGGFANDVPHWTMSWADVRTDHIAVAEASATFAMGPDGLANQAVTIDLEALGLADWPHHTVALQGVTFDTDVPADEGADPDYDTSHGWTPQRMGAGVTGVTVDGSTMTVDAWMDYKAGVLDRPAMNASVPYANVAGQLDLVVIGYRRDGVLTEGQLSAYDYILRIPPSYSPVDSLPADERTLTFAGEAGMPLGIPLLRGWHMLLNESIDEEGRYLRAFGARLEGWTYDAETGTGDALWDLFCSHSSLVEEGDLEVTYTVDADMLQVSDDAGSASLTAATQASDLGPLEVTLP